MIERRTLLRGLFAMPAIVAASSLMPVRGFSMIMPHELTDAEIVALLDKRLDEGWSAGKYEPGRSFARYSGNDHVEHKLGLCDSRSRDSVEWRARQEEYARSELAYLKGSGPMPEWWGK